MTRPAARYGSETSQKLWYLNIASLLLGHCKYYETKKKSVQSIELYNICARNKKNNIAIFRLRLIELLIIMNRQCNAINCSMIHHNTTQHLEQITFKHNLFSRSRVAFPYKNFHACSFNERLFFNLLVKYLVKCVETGWIVFTALKKKKE